MCLDLVLEVTSAEILAVLRDVQALQKACEFLLHVQRDDGGWAESYLSCVVRRHRRHSLPSTLLKMVCNTEQHPHVLSRSRDDPYVQRMSSTESNLLLHVAAGQGVHTARR